MSFQMYVHTIDTKGKLQSSVNPSDNNDLARKAYVDAQITAGTTSNTYWLEPVEDILAAQPSDPTSGSPRYLLASSGVTGASWAGNEDKIAEWNGSAWEFTDEDEGQAIWVKDADENRVYNGSSWVLMSSISGAVPLTKIGSAVGDLATTSKVLETKSGTSLAGGDLLTIDANAKIDKATAIPSTLLSDATTSSKGIIQVGDGLSVSGGVLSVDAGTDADKILRAGESLSDGDILAITNDGGLKVKAASSAQLTNAIGPASTSALGVARFSSDDFSVTAGAVSVDVGMSMNQIVESSEGLNNGSLLKAQSGEFDTSTTNAQLSGNYSEGNGYDTTFNSTTNKYEVVFENVSFSSGSFATIAVGDFLDGSGVSLEIIALDSSNDEITTQSDNNYHTSTTIMSPTIHPAQVQGIANASAANIADACRDASTSDKGVASFASADFSVSSGAVTLKRTLLNNASSAIPTAVSSPSNFSDLKEFYVFDLSGASSTATFTLPDLASQTNALGRKIEIAVLGGMSATNALTVSGGNNSSGYAQNIDNAASFTMSQNYQVLKLVVCKVPGSVESAASTVYKIV